MAETDIRETVLAIIDDAQTWDDGAEHYAERIMGLFAADRERQAAEITRLQSGGCARDQSTTQYCAEAAALAAEVAELRAEVERLRALTTWRPTHRHVKRGSEYMVVGVAELQLSYGELLEGHDLVVYRARDGKLWCREQTEFEDGRFEPLPPAPESSDA